MAKEKFTLESIKVESFVTTLEATQLQKVKGGYVIRGRQYTYRSRWTSVDTRVEVSTGLDTPTPGAPIRFT
jgi:hypothetical protein